MELKKEISRNIKTKGVIERNLGEPLKKLKIAEIDWSIMIYAVKKIKSEMNKLTIFSNL